MKNIHLIPTDKPSRLGQVHGKLSFFKDRRWDNTENWRSQNIYITNSEEIKEVDLMYCTTTASDAVGELRTAGKIYKSCLLSIEENNSIVETWGYINNRGEKQYIHYPDEMKKIILTTDLDLIKDGVQAIDDEFLEWFVMNPSCESVRVERNFADEGIKGITYYGKYFLVTPNEEPKQQTLQEAKDLKYYKNNAEEDYLKVPISVLRYISELEQQQEMYSEEDLRRAYSVGWVTKERFDDLSPDIVYPKGLDYEEKQDYAFNLWFEQFKKK